MVSPVTHLNNVPSFNDKISSNDLLNKIWDNRLTDAHGRKLSEVYFQYLKGKMSDIDYSIYSNGKEIDAWINKIFLAIENFEDEEKLIDLLNSEKQQPSFIRQWLNRISGKVTKVSEESESNRRERALHSLEKNLGLKNTLSLIGRGYQLARQLKENHGGDWQKAEKTEKLFENLLEKLASKHDINFEKSNLTKLTFRKERVSSEFLISSNSTNTRRNWLIGGVGLLALGIACVCLKQALEGQYHPAVGEPNQRDPFPDQAEDFPLADFKSEQCLDFDSKITQVDVRANPETGIWKNVHSYISSFWSHYDKPSYTSSTGYSINEIDRSLPAAINLYDFHKMTTEQQQFAIKKFELKESIESLGGSKFFKKLDQLDGEILKLANLLDLKFYSESFHLSYVLLTNEEFNQLTLKDELKDISFNEIFIIIKRLENLKKEPILDGNLKEDFNKLSLVDFSRLNSKQINRLMHQIPEKAFSLISNDQLMGLDLQKISQKQAYHLFNINSSQRISLLSSEKLNAVLNKLSGLNLKENITDDQFKRLNLKALTTDQIHDLLVSDPSKRIALLSVDQLQSILHKLHVFHLGYITDDQIKKLDLNILNPDQIHSLFAQDPAKRIALLSKYQIESIFDKIGVFNLRYITHDQLQKLNLADFKANQIYTLLVEDPAKRIALLSKDQFKSIFDKLSSSYLQEIGDDHFRQLNLTTLNADQIYYLFAKDPAKRIALLSSGELNAVLNKLNSIHLAYIKDDQLQKLNLEGLESEQISSLFNQDPAGRMALLSPYQIQSIVAKIKVFNLRYITDAQLQKLNLADFKAYEIQNLLGGDGDPARRMALLSKVQFKSIFDKLSHSNLKQVPDDQFKRLNVESLSADQIYSLFVENPAKRIALLSSGQLNAVLDKLSPFCLRDIPEDRIKKLNLTALNANQLNNLFFNDPASRIGLLSKDQLKSVLDKLGVSYLKPYLTEAQIKELT